MKTSKKLSTKDINFCKNFVLASEYDLETYLAIKVYIEHLPEHELLDLVTILLAFHTENKSNINSENWHLLHTVFHKNMWK